MNIAIDCRYLGMSGIGRVCEGILDSLDYSKNQFFLVGKKENLQGYNSATIIDDATNPYSNIGLRSKSFKKVNILCDAIIIPNFLIPFGIKIPIYTVVHDLIFLDEKKSVRNFIDKSIKVYLLKRCFKKSKKISCDSKFTLSRASTHFKNYASKCYLNYIGLSKDVISYNEKCTKEDTIIFVGNVKPHKGIDVLIKAFNNLNNSNFKLKIVGKKDYFLNGNLKFDDNNDNITFTGKISDTDLLKEIKSASFLVQPSYYEGFGLPPLESLILGTRPIVSDIQVFKEIYSGLDVTMFKCGDYNDLKNKIECASTKVNVDRKSILEKYNYTNFTRRLIEKICK